MDLYILDRRGRPVIEPDERVWAEAHDTDTRWKIDYDAWDAEEGRVSVDTRFLGFDPRPKEERVGRPVLWDSQTTLLPSDDDADPEPLERFCQWYQSRPAAVRGHERLVRELSGGGELEPPGGNGSR